jgi:hypothetical protein
VLDGAVTQFLNTLETATPSGKRKQLLDRLEELIGERVAEFESLSTPELSFVMGSALWKFDLLGEATWEGLSSEQFAALRPMIGRALTAGIELWPRHLNEAEYLLFRYLSERYGEEYITRMTWEVSAPTRVANKAHALPASRKKTR